VCSLGYDGAVALVSRQHRHRGHTCGQPRLMLLASPRAARGRARSCCVGKPPGMRPWYVDRVMLLQSMYSGERGPRWLRPPARQGGSSCCRWNDERHTPSLPNNGRPWAQLPSGEKYCMLPVTTCAFNRKQTKTSNAVQMGRRVWPDCCSGGVQVAASDVLGTQHIKLG